MVRSLLSRNEKAQGDVTNVYLVGGNEEEGSRLFSVVPHDRTRGTVHRIKQMKSAHSKTLVYCESGQTWEQFAQRTCGVSNCGSKSNWTQFWATCSK